MKDSDESFQNRRIKGLIKLCETRWVQRHDAVIRFLELFEVLIDTLNEIENSSKDSETRCKAYQLRNSMLSFEIIVSLECAVKLLGLSLNLSRSLQDKRSDIKTCYEQVNEIIYTVEKIRGDTKQVFQNIFSK